MKALILLVVVLLIVASSCGSQKSSSGSVAQKVEVKTDAEDSIEYELIVFDPGFEIYLLTVPYSKNFYSNAYYRNWNIQYSTEWNIRYRNPLTYGSFYESEIPYDASIDYGLDFNYRLYHYFRYVEKEYNIKLLHRGNRP
jgi:hypothetical protein